MVVVEILSPLRPSCPHRGARGITAGHGSPFLRSWQRARATAPPAAAAPALNTPTQAPFGIPSPCVTPPSVRITVGVVRDIVQDDPWRCLAAARGGGLPSRHRAGRHARASFPTGFLAFIRALLGL